MQITTHLDTANLVETLRAGGVAVLRTDTLYGIVASADSAEAVERVYRIKGRDPHKSCIVLLDTPSSSYGHSQELSFDIAKYADRPTSFLIAAEDAPQHLLRENSDIAYRVPQVPALLSLLSKTGPLIAPSANPESLPPARTVQQAIDYFGDQVDIYVDGGEVPESTPPSRVMRVRKDGTIERLR